MKCEDMHVTTFCTTNSVSAKNLFPDTNWCILWAA